LETAVPELAAQQDESIAPAAADPFAEYAEGRYPEAQQSAAALLRQQPGNAHAMTLQARILANQGHLAEALAWCDKAIAVEKLDAGFHYLRATILQEQSAISEAVKALKRSLFLDHNFVLAHFALGNLQRSLGRPREAEKHFENAVRLLNAYRPDEILPQSEGITAGRLRDIVDIRLTIVD
jgi:chemotaxis protein methyltransferase CheR